MFHEAQGTVVKSGLKEGFLVIQKDEGVADMVGALLGRPGYSLDLYDNTYRHIGTSTVCPLFDNALTDMFVRSAKDYRQRTGAMDVEIPVKYVTDNGDGLLFTSEPTQIVKLPGGRETIALTALGYARG
jgi:hypothetical protein